MPKNVTVDINPIDIALDKIYPVQIVSVVIDEKLSAEYEYAINHWSAIEKLMLAETDEKKKNKFTNDYVVAQNKAYAVMQFLVEKYAPDEYKELADPLFPKYSLPLKKLTFVIANEDTIRQRENAKASLISAVMKVMQNSFKGFKKDETRKKDDKRK
jgi:hypothetical protein